MKRSAMLREMKELLEAKQGSTASEVAQEILALCERLGMFPPLSDRFREMARRLNLSRDITMKMADLKWEPEEYGNK